MNRRLHGFCAAIIFAIAVLSGGRGKAAGLDGRVVDAVTGAGIEDATVIFAGRESRAARTGAFHVDGAGDRVLARAPGYWSRSFPVFELSQSAGLARLRPFTPKALYLTVYGIGSKSLRGGALALIHNGLANALVIDLKGDRGIVPYPSEVALSKSAGARRLTTVPDLAGLAKSLHASGIYLIARIVTFKDNPLATARPDLAIKRANGQIYRDREGLAWTDPFQSEVQDYNIDLAVEAAKAGFDEIQFDYVRFPDSSERLRLSKPSNSATRIQAISGFLAEAHRRISPFNVFLAVDVFGYVCWNQNDTGIGQRLEEIMPNVDYLSPMLYPSGFKFGIPGVKNPVANSYAIVRNSLTQARNRLNVSPKRFRPWLQAFKDYAFDRRLFDADEVADQIRAASDFGSDGWMFWNARNTYSGAGFATSGPRRPHAPVMQAASFSPSSVACF